MKIRIITLLIVMTMLVMSFASCGLGGKKNNNGGGNQGDEIELNENLPWGLTTLKFQVSENSDTNQLPSSSRRYLAGDLDGKEADRHRVDDYVEERNIAATKDSNCKVEYDYLPDTSKYGWSANIETIVTDSLTGKGPDVYINFVFDMVAASLKGAFANLYATAMPGDYTGAEHNYFAFSKNPSFVDTGDGYMYEYMKSLTLSKYKMYCLSSDYFIDMVRAFFVVPVNVQLLQSIPATNEPNQWNTNREATYITNEETGEPMENPNLTMEDFYALVKAGQWTYDSLIAFSKQIATGSGTSLGDRLGFALGTTSGLPASGMLYTSSITIVKQNVSTDGAFEFSYEYPNVDRVTNGGVVSHVYNEGKDSTFQELVAFSNAIKSLVTSKGIITVSSEAAGGYGASDTDAIRNRFTSNNMLFGGVIVLGALEHEDYVKMEGSGYGIAPVPLYRSGSNDTYLTQIHNNGKIGAISLKTDKFAQISYYLNYQSTHSAKVLNEYYNQKLASTVEAKGVKGNVEMLEYIRENVRSSFDKAMEDALGQFYKDQPGSTSEADKWHNMLRSSQFLLGDDISGKYEAIAIAKANNLYNLETKIFNDLPLCQ